MARDESKIGRLIEFLGRRWKCDFCGREHHVPTRWADLEKGSLERLPSRLRRAGWSGSLLLVADEVTHEVAGGRTSKLLSRDGFDVKETILEPEIEATRENSARVRSEIREDIVGIVAVGSGTINDLCKYAAFEAGKPYVVVPTAASMNGYTSSIAALSVEGVKRTLPAAPPIGVSTEPEIVASAPSRMNSSGFADLQSKSVADVDWRLSNYLFGEYYCPLPRMGVEAAEKSITGKLSRIPEGDPDVVVALLGALIESGISMAIAGSSSPASGGEHLISHWLDMHAHIAGREPAMHGEQVGIGTVISAKIYELWLRTPSNLWSPDEHAFAALDPESDEVKSRYGRIANEVAAEFRQKCLSESKANSLLKRLRNNRDELAELILDGWTSSDQLQSNLRTAGAPANCDGIGVSPQELKEAILHGREIRSRWTSLDSAFLVGVLPDQIEAAMRPVL